MSSSGGGVKAWPRGPLDRVLTRAAPHARLLANRNELGVSGSDNYVSLFLFLFYSHYDPTVTVLAAVPVCCVSSFLRTMAPRFVTNN